MEQKLSTIWTPLKGKKQLQEQMVDVTRFIEPYGEHLGQPGLIRFEPVNAKYAAMHNLKATDYANDSHPAMYVLRMRLKLDQMIIASLKSENFGEIQEDRDRYQNFCGLVGHTIKFGACPCRKVDSAEIEKQSLMRTNKSFPQFNRLEEYLENPEFKTQDNQYYVRTKAIDLSGKAPKTSWRKMFGLPEKEQYNYFKKELMQWYVVNYNAVSAGYDPENKNNTRYIELESKYIYTGDQVYGLQGSVPGYVSPRFLKDMCVMSVDFLKANGVKNVERLISQTQKQQDNEKTM